MKNRLKHYLQLLIAITGIIVMSGVLATKHNTLQTKQNQLHSITQQIQAIKKHLSFFQSKKTKIQSALKKIETNIGYTTSILRRTHQKLRQQNHQLITAKKSLVDYHHKLKLQKKLLAQQIKAAYMLGHQPFLKLLLNQEDPNRFARYVEYYRYLNQARLNIIKTIHETTKNIKDTSKVILHQTHRLSIIQRKQKKQSALLHRQHEKRQKLLSHTELLIQNKTSQLNKLIADKNALESIIQKLSKSRAFGYFPGASFKQMKGKLHWPIAHAKILRSFNQPIAYGRLHSTGILLGASMGTKVYAIFPGKVIFADWLRGFGLLIILQHSNGYLSLYARNQNLEVKTEDIVQAGQVIATVGNTGGYHRTALYFEIRHKSNPVNPLKWLKTRR